MTIKTVTMGNRQNIFAKSLVDILDALSNPRLWLSLGWRDVKVQYERSLIGPFWLSIQSAAWIGAIVFVFAGIMGEIEEYAIYVAIGIVLYSFITTIITDSSDLFIRNRIIIHSHPIPYFSIILRQVVIALVQLGFQAIPVLMVFILVRYSLPSIAWLALPGLVLGILMSINIVTIFSLIGLRYGDFRFFLLAIMRLGLFITPILWKVDTVSNFKYWVAELNPLTHFINLIRSPLMGDMPPAHSYYVVIILVVLSVLLSIILFAKLRSTIPMWL